MAIFYLIHAVAPAIPCKLAAIADIPVGRMNAAPVGCAQVYPALCIDRQAERILEVQTCRHKGCFCLKSP